MIAVMLVAIQRLYKIGREKDAEIADLKQQNADQKARLAQSERTVKGIAGLDGETGQDGLTY